MYLPKKKKEALFIKTKRYFVSLTFLAFLFPSPFLVHCLFAGVTLPLVLEKSQFLRFLRV